MYLHQVLRKIISQQCETVRLSRNFVSCLHSQKQSKHYKWPTNYVSLQSRSLNNDSSEFKTYVYRPYSYAYEKSDHNLEYLTIGEAFRQSAFIKPNALAIVSDHENISKTFKDVDNEIDKLANSLDDDLGLKKGDVVALWSANCYNWILIQLACARKGLVLCTLNPVYKVPELEYALVKSGAKLLFLPGNNSQQKVVNDFVGIASKISFSTTNLEKMIYIDGNMDAQIPLPCLSLHELMSASSPSSINSKQLDDKFKDVHCDDPAIIMFTSGTTGKPKGALLSHFNLINNAHLTGVRLGLNHDGSVASIPVPLFHIFGLVYGVIMMSRWGITMVLSGYRYNVEKVLSAAGKYKSTHIMIVPAMTIDIINWVEKNQVDLPQLKTVITGSAPTTVATVQKFLKQLTNTKNFLIRYGSTETGGCMTMPHPGDSPEVTMDNVGAPLDMTEVKIVDRKTGNLVKLGEQGELMVRGHHVMLGYWKDEEKTRETINSSNWFISGDIATMDEKGYVRIVGRVKELIIRGGENVYPKEVEELLHKHPLISEAYVCGVPDDRMGEEICAWVKLKNGSDKQKISTDEIREFCKDKISYFKVPRYVLIVDDFPRTLTGKAQKFMMTEKSCKILGIGKSNEAN